MEYPPKKFSLATVIHASGMNNSHMRDFRKKIDNFDDDPNKKARLEKRECKFCFYVRGRIGGAAMTTKLCDCCAVGVLYGSTCTGSVCKDCSKEYRVCTHCGEISMEKFAGNYNVL